MLILRATAEMLQGEKRLIVRSNTPFESIGSFLFCDVQKSTQSCKEWLHVLDALIDLRTDHYVATGNAYFIKCFANWTVILDLYACEDANIAEQVLVVKTSVFRDAICYWRTVIENVELHGIDWVETSDPFLDPDPSPNITVSEAEILAAVTASY